MDRALWLLIGMQLRGWLRSLGRTLQTPKGVVLVLIGLFVFIPWLALVLWQRGAGLPPERIRLYGPAWLLGYCLLNVLLSSGERAVYFSPAEVTFLFAGPFTRRQVLGYKVLITLLFGLPATLFMVAFCRAHAPWFAAAFVAVLLVVTFMQLFGMALNLAAGSVGARLYSRARKLLLAVALGVAVLALAFAGEGRVRAVLDSAAWQVLAAPLGWFFEAFLAETWPQLLRYGALGLLVDLALLGVVFGLDADYLEASAAYSGRVYHQLQRLRGGPSYAGNGDGPGPPPRPRTGLPMPPRLGGIGPVVWRQLTTAVRSPGRVLGLLVIQALIFGSALTGGREAGGLLIPVMGFAIVLLSLLLTTLLPFDFRGDLDRLEALKTLPLPPWRLALGQIVTPALVLTLLQWVMLGGLALLECVEPPSELGVLRFHLLLLAASAACALPFNLLLFGLENVLFLLFPSRLMAGSPADFQALGRNFLMMVAKGAVMVLAVGGAALAGTLVFLVAGRQLLPAFAIGWLVLAGAASLLVPVAGWVFSWIDLSRDKPA